MKKKILILGGGISGERSISLKTAKAVKKTPNIATITTKKKEPAFGFKLPHSLIPRTQLLFKIGFLTFNC